MDVSDAGPIYSTFAHFLSSNFWKPADHQKSIALLRRKYNFSPRLVEMITTRPPPISKAPISDDTSLSKKRDSSSSLVRSKADLEMGQLSPTSSTGSTLQREHNFYDIARNFTSYHSIDVGDQCKPYSCPLPYQKLTPAKLLLSGPTGCSH